ncbi:MAG: protease Do [Parcubacteria group bacterium Gr01-1014_48]|nr:MAG: protease Do [Parcubacteria group bacterium Greene0416_14]TSC71663.1 MAG: protease Do [Parcubacteria group bacterium Gr01-1014_48]TSD00934.1 MAG: protease Do [Parcubacteria group bacterium Greene1014_15]TSD07886.1 MAG: protease Do [Parcubacteria group bacterium Greene0714_4]
MYRNPFRFYAIALFFVCTCILHALPLRAQARGTAESQSYRALCASLDPALVYQQVERGVVKVLTEIDVDVKTVNGKPTLLFFGSAVYRGNGEFITNDHVINPEPWKNRRLFVETDDGKKYPATVLWNDPVHDLAKISIAQHFNLPVLAFGNSKNLLVADQVFSVGYQFGNKTFTSGSVASLEVKITQPLMELDITFNSGTSGGATFTCDGNIIGINIARLPGLGFIIPIDVVRQIEQHMDKFKTASYGSLGVSFVSVHLATQSDLQKFGIPPGRYDSGMLITAIRQNSAALKAGLEPGDIVVAVDDTILYHQYQFSRKVLYTPPGTTLSLSVLKRDGREVRLSARINKADDETIKGVVSQLKFLDRDI